MIFPVHRFRQLPPELGRTVENMTESTWPLQFRMYPVPVGEGLAFPLGKNGTQVVERKFIVSLNFSYRSQNLYFSANPYLFKPRRSWCEHRIYKWRKPVLV